MNTVKTFNHELFRDEMPLTDWEVLLASGWDRIGAHFFCRRFDFYQRLTLSAEQGTLFVALQLMPLRYKLWGGFRFTKSQRKIQRINSDLTRIYRPAFLDDAKLDLFNRWYYQRFGRYTSIFQWYNGEKSPFPTYEVCIYKLDKLVAVSFFDVTPNAQYSTLAFYDPDEMKRSLGTYTMISEIEFAMRNRRYSHYPGHAYYEKSAYEYKKHFNNTEYFDWETETWKLLRGG